MPRHRPIKILYDANAVATNGKSGVGYYASYMLQALADSYPDDVRIVGHYYNFLGRKKIGELPKGPNISYRVSWLWPGKATNLLRRFGVSIPFEFLVKARGDAIIFPNFLTLPSLFGSEIFTTIHDLGFMAHPEFVSERNLRDLQRYVPQSVRRSGLLLAVSEFTKSAVIETIGVPEQDILVTPAPPPARRDVPVKETGRLLQKLAVTGDYVLFVGNLEPRKNLITLLDAYVRLPAEVRNTYSLVIAGGAGWKNDDLRARIAGLQADGYKVITPGYVSDSERAALYSRASLMALPSLYEGFGMQILEAFQYGIPTAISDIAVFHEVAGKATVYFNPRDASGMAAVIGRALQDTALRKRLRDRQGQELAKYSWPVVAQELYAAISSRLDNR